MLFRKILVRLRKEYNTNKKNLFLYSSLASGLFVAVSLLVDAFVPFTTVWNLARTAVLVPTAASIFVLFYAIGLIQHYRLLESDQDWKPFRMRSSPTWRRRISAIAAAVGFIAVYANGYRVGYTLVSSLFVVLIIALFAYMRTTREESQREDFNIPDPRDTQYESFRKQMEESRYQKSLQKKREKEERKQNK